jgi:DNA invertase Pin-like site-specific DNA recombinase
MKIIVYTYTDPLLDKIPDLSIWGWDLDRIYQDIGSRKELYQLLTDIHTETIAYLIIFHLAELGDSLTQVINIIKQIEELNIEIIALNQDYKSSQFKTILDEDHKYKLNQIWLEINEIHHSRKLKQSHAKNRLKILPPPGKAPYGYSRGKDSYIINRATAPIMRAFFDRFLLYASIRDAVRFLANKYNKKITPSTARYWLTNPVYRGDLRYQNQQIIADTHTPIISREEAGQIERILKSHSRVKPRSASASYCLSGLVQCEKCQSNWKITSVTQRYKQKKYLYLTPTDCPQEKRCKSLLYDLVLAEVINNICHQFQLIQNSLKVPDIEIIKNQINTAIDKKNKVLNSLNDLVITEILDEQTAKLRNYQLKLEIAQLKNQLYQLPPNNLKTIAKTLSLQQFWYDLSEEEKRFYLREFVQLIKLNIDNNLSQKISLNLELFFSKNNFI